MYKIIYPDKDATLYERSPELNSGVDQILELSNIKEGQPVIDIYENEYYWDSNYSSRIIIKFSLPDEISDRNFSANLILRATEIEEVPAEYSVYAYPLSTDWTNGTGFHNNNPQITNGVSWIYKTSKLANQTWDTSSFSTNVTGSWNAVPGGGTWYYNISSSQTFNLEPADINMNVTNIVKLWASGSISNNGFIIKLSDNNEQNTDIYGQLKYFSRETHTIYVPRLIFNWDTVNYNNYNLIDEFDITASDCIVYFKNLKDAYIVGEKTIINLGVREKYPTPKYSTSSLYMQKYRLPIDSFYQIQDVVTDEIIVPFSELGTRVHCNQNGNYIVLDTNSIMPERFYKFVIKSVGAEYIKIFDNNYIFKICR